MGETMLGMLPICKLSPPLTRTIEDWAEYVLMPYMLMPNPEANVNMMPKPRMPNPGGSMGRSSNDTQLRNAHAPR